MNQQLKDIAEKSGLIFFTNGKRLLGSVEAFEKFAELILQANKQDTLDEQSEYLCETLVDNAMHAQTPIEMKGIIETAMYHSERRHAAQLQNAEPVGYININKHTGINEFKRYGKVSVKDGMKLFTHPPKDSTEPKLFSYAPDGRTCTLTFSGESYFYDRYINDSTEPATPSKDVLAEALRDTIITMERQLELIAERALGDFLDKKPIVQTLQQHVKQLKKSIATYSSTEQASKDSSVKRDAELPEEKVFDDAPSHLNSNEAAAYINGWNSCLDAIKEPK